MQKNKIFDTIAYASMALILFGVMMILGDQQWGVYAMIVGTVPFTVFRVVQRWNASGELQRLYGVMIVSALCFIVAIVAVFMKERFWILPVFLAALLDLYASFRLKEDKAK